MELVGPSPTAGRLVHSTANHTADHQELPDREEKIQPGSGGSMRRRPTVATAAIVPASKGFQALKYSITEVNFTLAQATKTVT